MHETVLVNYSKNADSRGMVRTLAAQLELRYCRPIWSLLAEKSTTALADPALMPAYIMQRQFDLFRESLQSSAAFRAGVLSALVMPNNVPLGALLATKVLFTLLKNSRNHLFRLNDLRTNTFIITSI